MGKKAPKSKSARSSKVKKAEEVEDVDYAAVADSYAGSGSDDDHEVDHNEDDNDDEFLGGPNQGEGEPSDSEDENEDASGESGSEVEEELDASDDNDSSDASDGEEEAEVDDTPDDAGALLRQPDKEAPKSARPAPGSHAEPCSFDLRNLLAMNTHQVDTVALYKPPRKVKKPSSPDDASAKPSTTTTIPGDSMPAVANDDVLLRMATDGCSQLIAALWQLPVERSDAGPLVTLPAYEELRIPRALPPPPPKQETKWEKFAKERGIAVNKTKRSQKVWDEATQSWGYRHGYNKANDSSKEWPIMEIKEGQDPYDDPWQAQREAKRAKVDKNAENQLKNQERAGSIPRGTASKVIKGRAKVRQAGIAGGNLDRDLPSGVPVDLPRSKKGDGDVSAANAAAAAPRPSQRGKKSTVDALVAVQRSTASLGKFDKMREGEPERKKTLASIKKRKYESATDNKVLSTESERGMKVLRAVVEGGGAAKERAIKKGKLAKGETAYDYDYSDGLGASSFRKKKGRAGAGKMKKMTKKRVK